MTDLALIALPDWVDSNPTMYFPMSILYLASMAKRGGYSVEVVDFRKGLSSLPDAKFYGFSCTTPQINVAKEIALSVEGKTIIGGPHPSLLPMDCVGHFDYIVRGEGEYILLEILSGKREPGVSVAPRIKNLDDIPFPAWDMVANPFSDTLFAGERYGKSDLAATLIGSRGCPFLCDFCANVHQALVYFRSAKNITEELDELRKRDVHHFRFEDDCFTVNPEFELLCNLMGMMDIHYKCHTRSNLLTPEKAKLLALSGCEECGLGVESADDKVLKLVHKKATSKQHRQAIKLLKDAGIRVKAYFIAGLPGETDETLELNKRFVEETQVDKWTLSTFTPYPGCLPTGSRIVCEDGVKNIENIVCGDTVVTSQGNHKVLSTSMRHYDGEVTTLTPYNIGVPVTLTNEHPVWVIERNKCKLKGYGNNYCSPRCSLINRFYHVKGKSGLINSHCRKCDFSTYLPKWMPASDVTKDMAVLYPIDRAVVDYSIDDELLNALGFYVAEGFTNGLYVITLTQNDKGVLEAYQATFSKYFGTKGKIRPHGNGYRLSLSSRKLVEFLSQFGKGAKNKRLPTWLMHLTINQQSSFLDGYFLGDGTLHRGNREYSTTSSTLAHQVCQLILRKNQIPSLKRRTRQTKFGLCSDYTVSELTNRQRVWIYGDYAVLPIKAIEKTIYTGDVCNLEVEDTPDYLTESFIVHNCAIYKRPGMFDIEITGHDWSKWWNFSDQFNHIIIGQKQEEMWNRYKSFYDWLKQGDWRK